METKFTKGEWIVDYGCTLGHIKAVNGDSDKTPTVAQYNLRSKLRGLNPTEEEIANAKLIASAPELIDVLLKLTNCIVGVDSLGCTIIRVPIELSQQIGVVIEKATV